MVGDNTFKINKVIVRDLGVQEYTPTWQLMQDFTDNRNESVIDEIWLLEHPPIFTQGQAGKAEHILAAGDIPVVQVDRGGQVTYHGPGQLMMYILIDVRRSKLGVRYLVDALEQCIVATLADDNILAYPKKDAPGVYVDEKKVCSVGLRIRKGCSFHGLAFNVNMDLSPFQRINPCGYAGMQMVDSQGLGGIADIKQAGQRVAQHFANALGIKQLIKKEGFDE
ncbi:lipoyl(octanoyl) transferase LipB [Glaciecola sp. KUL10]|uniref:lipoyl(octanoyl) transferase LipB n=1 Tax=Glaciecola sp. (strain KUL10) TaxID=2161813 RepID=UPI000D78C92A|nr:lipoyl(octanoyl) transferase LipB [Glaciecola sp. KUL10]